MILKNIFIIGKSHHPYSIHLNEDQIVSVKETSDRMLSDQGEPTFQFDQAIAFPGLINSHDHLEFNLYPQLSERIYQDYRDWGYSIHQKFPKIIENVLKIPEALRVQWGIYKNLICGVTTLIHHGNHFIQLEKPIIDIFQNCHSLHSILFEKRWRWKLNSPWNHPTKVIHIGEGTSSQMHSEINKILFWNLFKKKLIGIHGVAMDTHQARGFEALIWCPDSNHFLYDQTANIKELKHHTQILFGTDSTLTATWDLWQQLRVARNLQMLNDEELYQSLTTAPNQVWSLPRKGTLQEGYTADLVIAKKKKNTLWNAFYDITPEDILMVIKSGHLVYFDESLLPQIKKSEFPLNACTTIALNHSKKIIQRDIVPLINEIQHISPDISLPFSLVLR